MTTDTKNNAPLLNIDDVETYLAKPRFKTDENGVYWINIQHDKDGNATEKPPAPLCSTLSIVGSGIDQQGQAYRMIEYKNTITGQKQIHALANAKIGSNWNELQGLGITIYAGRQNREKLADYLQNKAAANNGTSPAKQAGYKAHISCPAAKSSAQTAKPTRCRAYTTTATKAKPTATPFQAASKNGKTTSHAMPSETAACA